MDLFKLPSDQVKEALDRTKRAELQAMFKRYHLQGANRKNNQLISDLVAYFARGEVAEAARAAPVTPCKPSLNNRPVGQDSPFVLLNQPSPMAPENDLVGDLRRRIRELELDLASAKKA